MDKALRILVSIFVGVLAILVLLKYVIIVVKNKEEGFLKVIIRTSIWGMKFELIAGIFLILGISLYLLLKSIFNL